MLTMKQIDHGGKNNSEITMPPIIMGVDVSKVRIRKVIV